MRAVRAVTLALLLLAPFSLVPAAATEADTPSVTVAARSRSYVGDGYDASIVVRGNLEDLTLALKVTPPLVQQQIELPSGVVCDANAMTCTFDGSSNAVVISVRGKISADAAGDVQRVQAILANAVGETLESESTTKALPRADLSLTMPKRATVAPGGSTTFTVTASNAGPTSTSAVVTFAGDRELVSIAAPSGASCTTTSWLSDDGYACTTEMPAGEVLTLAFTVTALTARRPGEQLPETRPLVALIYPTGAVAGALSVYYSALDPKLANNNARSTLVVSPVSQTQPSGTSGDDWTAFASNLRKTLTGPDSIMQDTEASFTLTVTNEGGRAAYDARVVVEIVNSQDSILSVTSPSGTCSISGDSATCEFNEIGRDQTVTAILVIAPPRLDSSEDFEIMSYLEENPETMKYHRVTVEPPETDLVFTGFSASPSTVNLGDAVDVRLSVHNDGPAPVRDAYVQIPLPSGLDVGDQSRGPCVLSGDNIRCFLGTIGAGASKSMSISVNADNAGDYTATGAVGSSVTDSDSGNNQKTLRLTVIAPDGAPK